jgi:hypothetical protein
MFTAVVMLLFFVVDGTCGASWCGYTSCGCSWSIWCLLAAVILMFLLRTVVVEHNYQYDSNDDHNDHHGYYDYSVRQVLVVSSARAYGNFRRLQ